MMKNNKSILIVDDDKMLFKTVREILEEEGHVVSCCDNGLDAVELSKEHDFDMILTDYNLPGMKGDALCRAIRSYRPDAYIIGFSIESKNRDFMKAGANKFIYKDELLQNLSLFHGLAETTP